MGTEQPKKTGTGLYENIAGLLCYVAGPITGILFLILEKDNRFVKFHAMQSCITSIAVFIIDSVLRIPLIVINFIPILGQIISILVGLVMIVGSIGIFVLLMVKAYQGEMYKLPFIGDLAEQYMDKINL